MCRVLFAEETGSSAQCNTSTVGGCGPALLLAVLCGFLTLLQSNSFFFTFLGHNDIMTMFSV